MEIRPVTPPYCEWCKALSDVMSGCYLCLVSLPEHGVSRKDEEIGRRNAGEFDDCSTCGGDGDHCEECAPSGPCMDDEPGFFADESGALCPEEDEAAMWDDEYTMDAAF